jgi:hypothetical protein
MPEELFGFAAVVAGIVVRHALVDPAFVRGDSARLQVIGHQVEYGQCAIAVKELREPFRQPVAGGQVSVPSLRVHEVLDVQLLRVRHDAADKNLLLSMSSRSLPSETIRTILRGSKPLIPVMGQPAEQVPQARHKSVGLPTGLSGAPSQRTPKHVDEKSCSFEVKHGRVGGQLHRTALVRAAQEHLRWMGEHVGSEHAFLAVAHRARHPAVVAVQMASSSNTETGRIAVVRNR